jgi:hypothetical protein
MLNKYGKVLPLKDMRKFLYSVTKCDDNGKVESGDIVKIEKNRDEFCKNSKIESEHESSTQKRH